MASFDWDEHAERYDRGRRLPPEAFAAWMASARRHAGTDVDRVLDLGCGTGMWSAALADTFDATVVGVEPSAGMRAQAAAKAHPKTNLIAGKAEQIPLRDSTCDAAWLSVVIHHFDDLDAAAKELRRVVHGAVLIRGAFPGRGPIGSFDRFFPTTHRTLDTVPSVEQTFEAFERAGFQTFYVEKVEQITAHSLSDFLDRIRLRADSALQSLPDREFHEGLRALEATARVEHGCVLDVLDFVVIR